MKIALLEVISILSFVQGREGTRGLGECGSRRDWVEWMGDRLGVRGRVYLEVAQGGVDLNISRHLVGVWMWGAYRMAIFQSPREFLLWPRKIPKFQQKE